MWGNGLAVTVASTSINSDGGDVGELLGLSTEALLDFVAGEFGGVSTSSLLVFAAPSVIVVILISSAAKTFACDKAPAKSNEALSA